MIILHYFLGFPPYRTGGLTKYAFDLMLSLKEKGHDVLALWPGEIKSYKSNPRIKKRKSISGIDNYEIINPLPVSLDEGICNFEEYTKECDSLIYETFLREIKPDVIHVHTLMGLHKEFIEAANRLKIKTVFTTHDYFGICPKVTLYRYRKCCDNDHGCEDCIQCNVNALSLKKIRIMQSPLYRKLKNSYIIKKLRASHREAFFENETIPAMPRIDIKKKSESYSELRKYYTDMLESMDIIHFNSTLTEKIYRKYITPKCSRVIPITNKEVKDNRNTNEWKHTDKLRILCLAPAKPYKGFKILKKALDELWDDGIRNFELRIFSPVQNPSPYMIVKEEGYDYSEIGSIFADSDVLVAPSIWYETFGFTVLEAISYGTPVIISENMGARDIVGNGGIVVKAGSAEDLKNVILGLTNEKLDELHFNILNSSHKFDWDEFVCENIKLYEEIS